MFVLYIHTYSNQSLICTETILCLKFLHLKWNINIIFFFFQLHIFLYRYRVYKKHCTYVEAATIKQRLVSYKIFCIKRTTHSFEWGGEGEGMGGGVCGRIPALKQRCPRVNPSWTPLSYRDLIKRQWRVSQSDGSFDWRLREMHIRVPLSVLIEIRQSERAGDTVHIMLISRTTWYHYVPLLMLYYIMPGMSRRTTSIRAGAFRPAFERAVRSRLALRSKIDAFFE